MPAFNLEASAHDFAQELTDLLNATVCKGVRISYAPQPNHPVVKVGYNLRADDTRLAPIPLTVTTPHRITGFLGVLYSLRADPESRYLAVESSVMAFSLTENMNDAMFHYDYEREKRDGYPEAHLQVNVDPPDWSEACDRRDLRKPFRKVHLPVGARRYRRTLEDLVACLIREELAQGHAGWESAVSDGHTRFSEKQLRAAVRRNPEIAREALEEVDRVSRAR